MSALDAANAYFDAWHAKDGAAVVASLSDGGTYCDPTTDGPIAGEAVKAHVEMLCAAFPDLSFEMKSVAGTGGGRVTAEWILRGTNLGPFRGLPATGKAIEVRGADFIETDGGKVTSVVVEFDAASVPRQLGL